MQWAAHWPAAGDINRWDTHVVLVVDLASDRGSIPRASTQDLFSHDLTASQSRRRSCFSCENTSHALNMSHAFVRLACGRTTAHGFDSVRIGSGAVWGARRDRAVSGSVLQYFVKRLAG